MIIDNSIDSSNVNVKIRNLSGTFDIKDVYTSYSGIPEARFLQVVFLAR